MRSTKVTNVTTSTQRLRTASMPTRSGQDSPQHRTQQQRTGDNRPRLKGCSTTTMPALIVARTSR